MIYEYGGEPYRVTLEPLPDGAIRATVGERVYTLNATQIDGGWLLTLDGAQVVAYTAAHGDARWVAVGGETFALSVPETRRGSRRARAAGGGDLTAQMPGQVREVLVAAGAAVERGQPLLLLEAMKMEIRITAPADGRIKRVLVQPGAVVDRGQRLLEIDEP